MASWVLLASLVTVILSFLCPFIHHIQLGDGLNADEDGTLLTAGTKELTQSQNCKKYFKKNKKNSDGPAWMTSSTYFFDIDMLI